MTLREITEDVARAAATDAANRQMRQNGRIAWNRDDLRLCAKTLDLLCPLNLNPEDSYHGM